MRDDMSWLSKGGIVSQGFKLYGDDNPEPIIPLDRIKDFELEGLELKDIKLEKLIEKIIKKMEIKYDRRKKKRVNDKHIKRVRSS